MPLRVQKLDDRSLLAPFSARRLRCVWPAERLRRAAGIGLVLALAAGFSTSARAQDKDGPADEGGRFVFHAADGAVLRLDRTSGQVSSCVKQEAGWACYAVADERAALEAEITRLGAENARLKESLLAKQMPLPSAPSGDASIEIRGPGVERIKAFALHLWERLAQTFSGPRP